MEDNKNKYCIALIDEDDKEWNLVFTAEVWADIVKSISTVDEVSELIK